MTPLLSKPYRPSGEPLLPAARALAPTSRECRAAILRMRQLGYTYAQLGLALGGVSKFVLESWVSGRRKPCIAARKLIELVFAETMNPDLGALSALMGCKVDQEGLGRARAELTRPPTTDQPNQAHSESGDKEQHGVDFKRVKESD